MITILERWSYFNKTKSTPGSIKAADSVMENWKKERSKRKVHFDKEAATPLPCFEFA